jgi:DNA primase
MGRIPEYIINEIEQQSKLLDIAANFLTLKKSGASQVGDCPLCSSTKTFNITPAKRIAKCFSCGKSAKTAVSFLQVFMGKHYVDSLKIVADYYHINWVEEEGAPVAKAVPGTAKRKAAAAVAAKAAANLPQSFRNQQLAASGIEEADQLIRLRTEDPDKEVEINRYMAGTLNDRFELIAGDDMYMVYVDLNRRRVTYTSKSSAKTRDMFRMRWQIPAIHPDKNGNPMKYQSPAGSGSKLWFPTSFIYQWEAGKTFETLFFHEGEKKADKAQKHGMASIGMMGIHNLAHEKQLPHEVQLIVKRGTKSVVFIVDSDYLDLGKNLVQSASYRPASFMKAVYNFQQYFFAFNNLGISLNIYFGYVRKNGAGEKGIDDLLAGSCAGKEDQVVKNIFHTMNVKSGEGQYLNVHNITGWSYFDFQKHFHLENVQSFARFNKAALKQHKVFRFGKELWKYIDDPSGEDVVELAQPLSESEKFWEESKVGRRGQEETRLRFNYLRCYRFLWNRGFANYESFEKRKYFVHVQDRVVRPVEADEIGRYVKNFVRTLDHEELSNMLFSGDLRYFSENSLRNLDFVQPEFLEAAKGLQYFFFAEKYWKITADSITESPISDLDGFVWSDQVSDRSAQVMDTMIKVSHIEDKTAAGDLRKGTFSIEFSDDADKCHFLLFLYRASNFYREKEVQGTALALDEQNECDRHFLQKCTAFGYLLHTHCDPRLTKAVIAMDAKISEVGSSEGRSGKSLLGKALQKLLPTVYIPGKAKDLTEDRFLLEEVEPGKTKVLWIDDVRVNFDFEFFFPFITGGAKYEVKGIRRTSLPPEKTPKLYICTNHAINERGGSFASRMIKLAFSDWYYDDGKGNMNSPLSEFGISFFDEWEFDQWNLFYNFAAVCLQLYFQFGIIPAPNDRIERRRLRQSIGEVFMEWADTYFANPIHVNVKVERKVFNDDFYSSHPELRKLYDPRLLKKKLIEWCEYSYHIFNPNVSRKDSAHGGDIKSGGTEYFIVANDKYSKLDLPDDTDTLPAQTPLFT